VDQKHSSVGPSDGIDGASGIGVETGARKTPPGSCTVTLTSSTCAPEFAVQHQRILTGAGSCTQPAAPQAGTAGSSVNVGSFTFTGFFDPP
jgi:hypothetical protein